MEHKTLFPLTDRVVIRQHEEVEFVGRVRLPDSEREKPSVGTIIAFGDDAPKGIRVGDVVLYAKYAGVPVEVEPGKELLVIRGEQIHVIVKEGEKE